MQGSEWIIVAVVLLLLFGGTQIPKLARSIGQAQKEFKQGLKDGATEGEPENADAKPAAKADAKAEATTDSAPDDKT